MLLIFHVFLTFSNFQSSCVTQSSIRKMGQLYYCNGHFDLFLLVETEWHGGVQMSSRGYSSNKGRSRSSTDVSWTCLYHRICTKGLSFVKRMRYYYILCSIRLFHLVWPKSHNICFMKPVLNVFICSQRTFCWIAQLLATCWERQELHGHRILWCSEAIRKKLWRRGRHDMFGRPVWNTWALSQRLGSPQSGHLLSTTNLCIPLAMISNE